MSDTPGEGTPQTTPRQRALEAVTAFLADGDVSWEPGAHEDEFVVSLPGERKLTTVCSLLLRDTALTVTAFVIRHPDENEATFYRFLLQRNLRLPGIAYAVDGDGDVYVTGRVPLEGLTTAYLDQLLGVVLEASDGIFNDLLVLGFLESMKKEWAWRVSRGESTRNLEAFRHLLE